MSVYDFEDKKGVGQYWRDEYGIPFQRVGSAVDYAQCIIGLVVNQYITGTNVVIDGAWLAGQGELPTVGPWLTFRVLDAASMHGSMAKRGARCMVGWRGLMSLVAIAETEWLARSFLGSSQARPNSGPRSTAGSFSSVTKGRPQRPDEGVAVILWPIVTEGSGIC
jgi:hypothetical protein